MAFDIIQESEYHGKPVRCYEFKLGTFKYPTDPEDPQYDTPGMLGEAVWRYCDADRPVNISIGVTIVPGEAPTPNDPVTFLPMNISDRGIVMSGSASADAFEVLMPADATIPTRFRGSPPSQIIALTVYDVHTSDENLEAQVVWVGEVAEVRFPEPDRAQLNCTTLAAAFSRTGLRLSWGRNCPHVLYDENCGLKIRKFATQTTIEEIVSGTQVRLGATFDNDLYAGGMLIWTSPGPYNDTIGIETMDGDVANVFGLTDKLIGITDVFIVRGCARTMEACMSFNPDDPDRPGETTNKLNFGGAPHLPGKNPFDGTPIF